MKLKTRGNWLGTRTEILWGERVVAVLSKNVLSCKSVITIAEGMDMALAVAVGIIMDEKRNENNGA